MKKLIAILLLMCIVSVPTSATAFAQSEDETTVLIEPVWYDEITVTSEQNLILRSGWGACTPGLVEAFINAIHYEWTIDGEVAFPHEETDQYFGPISAWGPKPECIAGPGTLWSSKFEYSIGTLPVGTYEITLDQRVDHRLTDGGDWDGDGRMDFTEGTFNISSVTVHVVDE